MDHGRRGDQPWAAVAGDGVVTAVGARYARLLLRLTDAEDALAPGPPRMGRVRVHHDAIVPRALDIPHPRLGSTMFPPTSRVTPLLVVLAGNPAPLASLAGIHTHARGLVGGAVIAALALSATCAAKSTSSPSQSIVSVRCELRRRLTASRHRYGRPPRRLPKPVQPRRSGARQHRRSSVLNPAADPRYGLPAGRPPLMARASDKRNPPSHRAFPVRRGARFGAKNAPPPPP